ncbi:alpha/beta fold hydrolase [Streptomyces sp. NPDC102274]|uniref:alpha/beta fold hydrolase n=1 Tax=Streptomyces sp. NPDC102274 TaxID=3366151 RepID=UPI003804B31A
MNIPVLRNGRAGRVGSDYPRGDRRRHRLLRHLGRVRRRRRGHPLKLPVSGPYTTLGDPAMPTYAQHRHLAASNRHDVWDVLPDNSAPTLVVHGSDDLLNPTANAPLLADRIPGARLQLIPGARHAYFEEFRATAGPLVLDFLDRARPHH